MLGDTSDTIWGVMDVYPQTSFPDIRKKCTIHSSAGNLIIIPREGGQLARFYIQLPAGTQAKQVTLLDLQDATRKIFAPYTMEFAYVFWWSAYSIGQRLVEQFHKDYRVFLTGDAAHTHSPKAGQGMNVSLQDGFNIGWKLGSVLSGISPPSVLHTYVSERSKTAADLIEFDKVLAGMFSRKEQHPGEFSEYFVKSGRYMAGFAAKYDDAPVTSYDEGNGGVAKGIVVGMRFPSAQVIRLADCKAVPLQSVLQSDGRWRVVIFGGDINDPEHKARLEKVCVPVHVESPANPEKLAHYLKRVARTFTLTIRDIDSLIEPILVLSSKYLETEQEAIPEYFSPVGGKYKMKGILHLTLIFTGCIWYTNHVDLHKTYIDDEHYNSRHGHAYEIYGVDPNAGAVVVVRPDQCTFDTFGLAQN
jgi:phenol 2-monooxygenase